MDQLFLLEILVDTIYFKSVDNVPIKKQINIVATFANITSLEIRNDGLGGVEEGSKSADVDFNSGKSYLFPCSVDKLLKAFADYPLQVMVGTKSNPQPIGLALINWSSDFVQMVDSCSDNMGYITPVSQRDIYPLKDSAGNESGHVEVFVRLSCFGKNIQTQFQVVHTKDPKDGIPKTQFLFKSTNAATTFQCQRFGLGTSAENIPIGPVYNTAELDDTTLKAFFTDFNPTIPGSAMPSAFNLEQLIQQKFSNILPDDQLSLMFRMDNNKFFNIPELCPSGISTIHGVNIPDEELTVENINKMLCKDCDCPAVKKFKEYGIGPLATGKGIGTVYGEVDPPVFYGMSHANGILENYGPYGLYKRPKRPDQEYVPRETSSASSSSRSSSTSSTSKSKCSRCSCQNGVLRLSGGAPIEEREQPSPMHACKSLMQGFDNLVEAYKKALGPCGQATCPFAQNLIDEACREYCPANPKHCPAMPVRKLVDAKSPDAGSISSCGASTCPYAREIIQPIEPEIKLKQTAPACGEPNCPYAKKQLGILDEDVDEATCQLAKLPKNCGAPICPYRVEDPLPPIHWDCPDPLPQGRCKNVDCPILKAQGIVAQVFQCPKSPCDAPRCPYAMPPPCDFPGCPFGPPVPCSIPGCPFGPSLQPLICSDPECPLNAIKTSSSEVCFDPSCPYYKPPCQRSAKVSQKADIISTSGAGDSSRKVCPCCGGSQGRSDGKLDGNPTETVIMDAIEACTPYSCKQGPEQGASLECLVCQGGFAGASSLSGDIECNELTCQGKGGTIVCDECFGQPDPERSKQGFLEFPTETTRQDAIEPCTPNTCMATGGSLECLVCPCSEAAQKQVVDGRDSIPDVTRRKKTSGTKASSSKPSTIAKKPTKKRKKKGRYVLDSGDTYPGVKIGHRFCVTPSLNVPHNMGWLWNVKPVGGLRPRRGWKPGALTKTMLEIIERHRALAGIKPLVPPTPKPSKKKMRKNAYGVYESDSDISIPPKPTLQIKKKDGCYLITMNPLKDPYSLEDNENPYMDCTPMQFKITKNKPPQPILLCEEEEFSGGYCECDDDEIKSTSSESELDIEFTPPAGIIHPDRLRKKKNVVHQDTQYSPDDLPKAEVIQLKGKGGKGKGKGKGGKGKGGKGKGKKKK